MHRQLGERAAVAVGALADERDIAACNFALEGLLRALGGVGFLPAASTVAEFRRVESDDADAFVANTDRVAVIDGDEFMKGALSRAPFREACWVLLLSMGSKVVGCGASTGFRPGRAKEERLNGYGLGGWSTADFDNHSSHQNSKQSGEADIAPKRDWYWANGNSSRLSVANSPRARLVSGFEM